MLIANLIGRSHIYYNKYLRKMGLPLDFYIPRGEYNSARGVYYDEVDDVPLSRYAKKQFEELRKSRDVTSYLTVFFRARNGSVLSILLTIFLLAAAVLYSGHLAFEWALAQESGDWRLVLGAAALGAWLPIELWSLKSLFQHMFMTDVIKHVVQEKAGDILERNRQDYELSLETQSLIDEYRQRLTAEAMVCDESDRVSPAIGDWVVEDVQYHAGDEIGDRDATITLISAGGHDAVTCVLPSKKTVERWFDRLLAGMQSKVKQNTHTWQVLSDVSAIKLLGGAWQRPTDVLSEVAQLLRSSKLPSGERAPVSLFGQKMPEGQVMIQSIGLDDDRKASLVFAPTAPVTQLTHVVQQRLSSKGHHPALLSEVAA